MANWLLLLALISFLPAVNGWLIYRRHQANFRAARARGWRFAPVSVRVILRPRFILAGKTPGRMVWELSRNELRGLRYLEWRARSAVLPYGRLQVGPAGRAWAPAGQLAPIARAVPPPRPTWPHAFTLLTTHDALVARYIPAAVDTLLARFPSWPMSGALANVEWGRDGLLIRCRYDVDWATIDRMVALGTALTDSRKLSAA